MKKILSLITITLTVLSLYGKEFNEGYVVLRETKDTLVGLVNDRTLSGEYRGIFFKASEDVKATKYQKKDVLYYFNGTDEYHIIDFSEEAALAKGKTPKGPYDLINPVILDGRIMLYKACLTAGHTDANISLWTDKGAFMTYDRSSKRWTSLSLFPVKLFAYAIKKDNKEMYQEIMDNIKSLSKEDLPDLVQEFNTWAATQE